MGEAAAEEWVVCRGAERHPVRVTRAGAELVVTGDGVARRVATPWHPGQPLMRASVDGVPGIWQIARHGIGFALSHAGWRLELIVLPPRAAELLERMPEKRQADLSHLLLAPMPGLLVSIAVAEGQDVKPGEELAVIEAMKMENVLRAEREGKIAKIHAHQGDSLAADQIILEFA
jgi:propionyl-CoA carboxylase alpha chain